MTKHFGLFIEQALELPTVPNVDQELSIEASVDYAKILTIIFKIGTYSWEVAKKCAFNHSLDGPPVNACIKQSFRFWGLHRVCYANRNMWL